MVKKTTKPAAKAAAKPDKLTRVIKVCLSEAEYAAIADAARAQSRTMSNLTRCLTLEAIERSAA